jgi:ABC-type cobalamin transport system permease subunit
MDNFGFTVAVGSAYYQTSITSVLIGFGVIPVSKVASVLMMVLLMMGSLRDPRRCEGSYQISGTLVTWF